MDDDFLESWVDVREVMPELGQEPFFITEEQCAHATGQLREADFQVIEIDLSGLQNDTEFVTDLGSRIGAPSYFGNNWDALNDVLREKASATTWKIALIASGCRDFAARNLHGYSIIVSTLRLISERSSNIDAPVGQLEIFYVDG